ncbi:winged helix-turn-helix domain-containing protein, partial [Streptomyces seoulensis]
MSVDPEHVSATGRNRSPRSQPSRVTSRVVADTLRTRIDTGVLRPGERLPTQAELAEEFGVERGTVREALRILRVERLL